MFVYAQNAKGSSQPFVLKETLKAPSPSAKSAAAAASNGRGHNKHAGVEGNNIVAKMYLVMMKEFQSTFPAFDE